MDANRRKSRLAHPLGALALGAALLVLSGCQGYEIKSRNLFADDNGQAVVVDYGSGASDHVNTFVSPVTNQELEFKSRLMVRVELPDGERIVAWQCMNFLPRGTMYETDDREWKVLANGFSTIIYRRTGEPPPRDYLEVFRGVLCDSPKISVPKNSKWRDITYARGREYRKPSPVKTK